ncbi:hypothetical protein BTUL_0057g00350 [Botrytis tulipae]|uniref:Uncharacterized protein n=1 Tax=Botrytis tulipae TaxID=87230 RepID=A0A4Z1ERY0_9HELO|nr:hypothetical protein BTUL_0057g00350 [Botrytis tulipae]
MHLHLSVLLWPLLFQGAISVPTNFSLTSKANKCYEDSSKVLKPDMTCDQLPENTCFYTVTTFLKPESATTSITDWNCVSYGEDHFVFNRKKASFGMDAGPMEVKGRIWVVSNLTRLNAPESNIGISGWYTGSCSFPQLKWQGKKYLVYLSESIEDALLSLIPLAVKSHVYRITIPC